MSLSLPCGHKRDQLIRKVFLSRFLSTGKSAILKYENEPLDSDLYHMVENVFIRYRDIMHKGELVDSFVNEKCAWWIIRKGHNLLVPLISLENPDREAPGVITIDYSEVNSTNRILTVLEYDFSSSGGDLFLCGDEKILCEDMDYGEIRLYSIQ